MQKPRKATTFLYIKMFGNQLFFGRKMPQMPYLPNLGIYDVFVCDHASDFYDKNLRNFKY